MFSWSKKNEKKPRRRAGGGGPVLNEFGLPVSQANQGGNDEELEAELRALTGGVISLEEDLDLNDEGSDVEAEFAKLFGDSKKKKKKSKRVEGRGGNGWEVSADDHADVLVKEDVNINDEEFDDGNDEDLDVDENDPELLGELMGLTEVDDNEEEEEEEEEEESEEKEPEKKEVTVTSMLEERLAMYKAAEEKAKKNNESSRARRFARGIKTLQQLIKKAQAGQPVLPSEIPPVIATNLKPAPPAPAPPTAPAHTEEDARKVPEPVAPVEEMERLTTDDNPPQAEDPPPQPEPPRVATPPPPPPRASENPLVAMLTARRDEYKASALTAKKNDDLETALKHVKCVKQLNALISAAEQGQEIDESQVPPSLSQPAETKPMEVVTPLKFEAPEEVEMDEYEIPTTVLDALNQRLRIYQRFLRDAENAGNETGVKRNSKIVQIYTEAIKLHKAGKRVPLLKLPTPPGCPPIPIPFDVFGLE